ncbi:hypothetical protein FJZ31_39595 [Candidatus Poribacteria bacterium]|nr:hypothetical protein [Candidatus Poribacteria bacterium]
MFSGSRTKRYFIMVLVVAVLIMLIMPHHAPAVNKKYNRIARLGTPIVDGALNDKVWQGADWQEMDVYAGGVQPKGFKAKSAVLWDDKCLYTAIEVDDTEHAVPKAVAPGADTIWNGDSPQHRVDLEYDSVSNSGLDIEWGYALQDGKILTHAWASPANIVFDTVTIIRDDNQKKTYYEVAVILTLHKPQMTLSEYVKDNNDAKIGYSDMVNANAGGARLGWLEWSSGIGASKDANQFGTLTFDHTPQALVPADKLAATWGDLKRVH